MKGIGIERESVKERDRNREREWKEEENRAKYSKYNKIYIILFLLQNYKNLKKNSLKSKFNINRIFTPER